MKKNIYLDIYIDLKEKIENGLIEKKLPAVRNLSKILNISSSTVVRAYKELEKNSYVFSKEGSGFYINEHKKHQVFLEDHFSSEVYNLNFYNNKHDIDLASAYPDNSFLPLDDIKKSIDFVLDRDRENAFFYDDRKGLISLRKSIANISNKSYSKQISLDNIQILSGAQQAIDIISASLVNQSDTIVVEDPSYKGAIDSFTKKGAEILRVNMESNGFSINELKEILKHKKIKLFYTMPNFQNPSGVSISYLKKLELLSLAKKYNFYIVEDDGLSDLYYSGKKPSSLKSMDKNDRVIYIKSFSKVFMPSLRLAYLCIPDSLKDNILINKCSDSIYHFGLLERAFQHFLENGYLTKHINYARDIFLKRQKIMIEELNKIKNIKFRIPNGGLSFWIELPKNISGKAVYFSLMNKKIAIVPGVVFSNNKDNYIRISFAQCEENEIKKAINTLKYVLEYLVSFNK